MHELIASPFLGDHLIVRPGSRQGLKISHARYRELANVTTESPCPTWLREAARRTWSLNLSGRSFTDVVLVRKQSPFGFGRASYELNLGCNYDCEHCYLGLKRFEGLPWEDRERLLHIMRDAGVLWLQLTGGEPMIDRLFPEVYGLAYELGMMLSILSNGSRLSNPKILDLLTSRPPYRITLSVYGATADSYDGLTRRKGAFRLFQKGLYAACEAGLPLALSMIVTRHNAHEVDQMRDLAERLGLPFDEYVNMVPTIYGGAETLPAQSKDHLRKRKVFTGCNAGHTFFHVDPHGKASICKVGRDPSVSLMDEGIESLHHLGGIADRLLLRQGGCTGCTLSGTCGTCMPLVQLYRRAKAPLATYCQHREPREEVTR
ncbi:radical SAM protein [Thermomonospora cellulosilytica]|uniref:MoaA/NifB/PqqE/SkfB family radical SAM enzyme n=1 Tax=Thermomonospora cellulosilytica TaxID=1411118 RepID=A0A7W3R6I5_9ACTN|nr:radical SAM protein [Thermomonospora cellulosilytica]MBA9001576.1 MoaA/NifB/PqqE/SkfB family radical SAM enzyme [Thermomonospora cellulosilytica]